MLRIDDADRVRLLTLDRPEALNAFHTPLYRAVSDALDEATARPDLACVVITGEGRAFSAGQDLGEMGGIDPTDGAHAEHGFRRFADTILAFPKPLVAAVNGIAVGIGATMLLHSDLVLVSHAARLKLPFVSLGVVPEAAGSLLLPVAMGWQHAAHALFTASWIGADDAVARGLAWRACAPDALLDEALTVAREIAGMPVASLVATKRLLLAARHDAVVAARAREDAAFAEMVGGPANLEAITAFLEKRPPDFTHL